MRCYCCNCILTPFESTLKSITDHIYTDMCLYCLKEAGINVTGNILLEEDEVGTEVANYVDNEDKGVYFD